MGMVTFVIWLLLKNLFSNCLSDLSLPVSVFIKRDASLILKFLLILDDHSRVKLQNTENDYINASLVVIEEAQRYYILTQVSHTN